MELIREKGIHLPRYSLFLPQFPADPHPPLPVEIIFVTLQQLVTYKKSISCIFALLTNQ